MLYKKKSGEFGYGVFSSVPIPKNSLIFPFVGALVTTDVLNNTYKDLDTLSRAIQIGTNQYLSPSYYMDGMINHSCKPNAGIHIYDEGNNPRGIIFSIEDIQPHQEIFYDYSSSQIDKDWSMICCCGEKNCRKLISTVETIPLISILRYWFNGVLPSYARKRWIDFKINNLKESLNGFNPK